MNPPSRRPRELHAALALGLGMTSCLVAILVTTVLAINRPPPDVEPMDWLLPPVERADPPAAEPPVEPPGNGTEPAVHEALRRLLA